MAVVIQFNLRDFNLKTCVRLHYMLCMQMVMAGVTYRFQPFDGFLTNVHFGISFMMHLGSPVATIHTCPVIALQHHITFAFPGI